MNYLFMGSLIEREKKVHRRQTDQSDCRETVKRCYGKGDEEGCLVLKSFRNM